MEFRLRHLRLALVRRHAAGTAASWLLEPLVGRRGQRPERFLRWGPGLRVRFPST